MEVFTLLFTLAFLALLIALVVMSICKSIKLKKLNDSKRRVSYGLESPMMKREVNEVQDKWKETLPKHSTRIKLRNYRKLRNKRKGHSKGVKGKKK